MTSPAPEAVVPASDSQRVADRDGALSFPVVAAIFATLLALGVGLAVVIHRSYVGFERVAAHHVPPDSTLVLRWDVEKVSLFEPTRHFLLPLLDERPGTAAAPPSSAPSGTPKGEPPSRRDRFARESGSMIGRDLREAIALWGPGENDWALVLGGSFPKVDLVAAVARTLAAEGWPWRQEGAARLVSPEGLALGRAEDGAVAIASSAARLDAVLVVRPAPPEIPRVGAGSLRLGLARSGLPAGADDMLAELGAPSAVNGEALWGSPLPISVTLHYSGAPPADAKNRVRKVLDELLASDLARIERQEGPVKVQEGGNGIVKITVLVDDVALERAANRAAEAVERALGHGPARE